MLNIKIKYIIRVLYWSCLLLAILLLQPISYGVFRLATVLVFSFLLLGATFLFWRNVFVRFSSIFLSTVIFSVAVLPGAKADPAALTEAYVAGLDFYEGTPYVWGGENKLGIDCSGLIRQGLVHANFQYGLTSLNPALIREAFSLWWFDSSAEALAGKYRNKTKLLFSASSINALDHSKIQKGDFAVTQDGKHALAYIGNNIWIEANPGIKKVIKVKTPDPSNAWFNTPVNIVRWQQLKID